MRKILLLRKEGHSVENSARPKLSSVIRSLFTHCLILAALLMLLLGGFAGQASANNDVVTSSADDGSSGTLRSVIGYAQAGDTITFAPGISHITLTQGVIGIYNSMTISGPGASKLAIDGNSNGDVFGIHNIYTPSSLITISGLTIENGNSCGCFIDSSDVSFSACVFTGNTTVSTYFYQGDTAGGVYVFDSTVSLSGCTLNNNIVGLACDSGGNATLTNCVLSGNSGPGLANTDLGASTTLTNCTMDENDSGFDNYDGAAILTGCTLNDNTYGGFFNSATASLTGCTISGNGNSSTYAGGGLDSDYGTLTLTGCTISGNSAGYYGGGFSNSYPATASLTGCTISSNQTTSDDDDIPTAGGGIYSEGGLVMTTCQVVGNTANSGAGGGVYNNNIYSGAKLDTITNCTFSGNSAVASANFPTGVGGGLYDASAYNPQTAPPLLTSDIFWNDTAASFGAEVYGPPAANVTYCDIQGGDYETQQNPYPGTGNIDADPLFVNAPTDLHLLPTSPCRGKGATQAEAPADVTIPTTDFDGLTRPGNPSIGAFDLPGSATALTTTTALATLPNPDAYTIYSDIPPLTATVTASDGTTPTGTVTFTDNGTQIGTAQLVNGQATLTIPIYETVELGPNTFAASYEGNSPYPASDSSSQNITLTAQGTVIASSSAPDSVTFGTPITLTAEIAAYGGANEFYKATSYSLGSNGALTPDPFYPLSELVAGGQVSFYSDATLIGTVTIGYYGMASLTVSSLPVGTHIISMYYGGSTYISPGDTSIFGELTQTITSVTAGKAVLTYGNVVATRSGSVVTVTGTLLNSGTATATGTQVTVAKLGTTAANKPLAGPFTIPAGGSQTVTLTFTGVPSGKASLSVGGTAAGGLSFSTSRNILVP
jgi:hypothetical protein